MAISVGKPSFPFLTIQDHPFRKDISNWYACKQLCGSDTIFVGSDSGSGLMSDLNPNLDLGQVLVCFQTEFSGQNLPLHICPQ